MTAYDQTATYLNDISLALATAAHRGTSFTPERRGEQEISGYAGQLALDYVAMSKLATTDEKRAALAEEWERYRIGYRDRTVTMLAAKSRCLSTMIAGPSNFNVRRHSKRSDAADARTRELVEFRTRALDAIRKVMQPELRPVMAGDDDAVERLTAKIKAEETLHARMVDANAAIRAHAREGAESQVIALVALGFTNKQARELIQPDYMGRVGFASYQLSNSSANLRRMRIRLEQITVAKATPVTTAKSVTTAVMLEDDPGANRVRLFFPGKPDEQTRSRLKSAGFRWAPSVRAWQAYRNPRATDIARRIAGIDAPAPSAAAPEADSEVYACPDGAACRDQDCIDENTSRAAAGA